MPFILAGSKVDKESLRKYVLSELQDVQNSIRAVTTSEDGKKFWERIRLEISSVEDEKLKEGYLRALSQIVGLSQFIDSWVHSSVDTPERMEFFILSKATEVKTGDQEKDYFWALQIRHDQLVALVKVLSDLSEHLKRWKELEPGSVLTDAVYQGLLSYSIEDQIYLEAEAIHREREGHLSV